MTEQGQDWVARVGELERLTDTFWYNGVDPQDYPTTEAAKQATLDWMWDAHPELDTDERRVVSNYLGRLS